MAFLKNLKATCFVAAAGTILVTAGCQNQQTTESDTQHSQAEISETETLEHTQMAAGYRAECTLYASHFDGAGLSSLGTHALDLALADSHSCNPLVVYLAVPDDNYAQDRRLAVGRYLEDRGGLKPEQIEFQSGPNPATYSPVQDQLTNYQKTDTASDIASGSGMGGNTGGGGGGGGGSPGH
jgi:hypothetical protein